MERTALTFGLNVNPVQREQTLFFYSLSRCGNVMGDSCALFKSLREGGMKSGRRGTGVQLPRIFSPLLRRHLQPRRNVIGSTCGMSVRSEDMIRSLLLCTGVSPDRAWARGAETDGSSSCRSEHEAPERSLQSVVPVLNIDRSKTASVES